MSMHARNPYRNPPDFNLLADAYDKLKPHLTFDPESRRTTIDFKDEEAQRRLTEAIMLRDFGVTLHIPLTRLCPPVPNRMNYALWIQDIVRAHEHTIGPLSRSIRGIDIGTGATSIYPFLICKLEPSWEMMATELDEESYESARMNVAQNCMEPRIHVKKALADEMILFPLEDEMHSRDNFEFTMCNPPFYAGADEISHSAQDKEHPPNAVCTGADIEMIYSDGGEEGFVGRIVEESVRFQTRCKWYTSMLGKMSSVSTIVEKLRQFSITNYAITEFIQGQTRRWAIAWSFTDSRLPDAISRIPSITSKHALYPTMPPKNTLIQPFPEYTMKQVFSSLSDTLQSIENVSSTGVNPPNPTSELDDFNPEKHISAFGQGDSPALFFVEAQGNTWSRSARRSRNKRQSEALGAFASASKVSPTISNSKPALTCSCRVVQDTGGLSDDSATDGPPQVCAVEFQWIFGEERSLFESFVGHVGRKVASALRVGNT